MASRNALPCVLSAALLTVLSYSAISRLMPRISSLRSVESVNAVTLLIVFFLCRFGDKDHDCTIMIE